MRINESISSLIGQLVVNVKKAGTDTVYDVSGEIHTGQTSDGIVIKAINRRFRPGGVRLEEITLENIQLLKDWEGYSIGMDELAWLWVLFYDDQPLIPVWWNDDEMLWCFKDHKRIEVIDLLLEIDENNHAGEYLPYICMLPQFNTWFKENRQHMEKS